MSCVHAQSHAKHVGIGLTIVGLVVGGAGIGLYAATAKDRSMFAGVAGVGLGALVGGLTILTF